MVASRLGLKLEGIARYADEGIRDFEVLLAKHAEFTQWLAEFLASKEAPKEE